MQLAKRIFDLLHGTFPEDETPLRRLQQKMILGLLLECMDFVEGHRDLIRTEPETANSLFDVRLNALPYSDFIKQHSMLQELLSSLKSSVLTGQMASLSRSINDVTILLDPTLKDIIAAIYRIVKNQVLSADKYESLKKQLLSGGLSQEDLDFWNKSLAFFEEEYPQNNGQHCLSILRSNLNGRISAECISMHIMAVRERNSTNSEIDLINSKLDLITSQRQQHLAKVCHNMEKEYFLCLMKDNTRTIQQTREILAREPEQCTDTILDKTDLALSKLMELISSIVFLIFQTICFACESLCSLVIEGMMIGYKILQQPASPEVATR